MREGSMKGLCYYCHGKKDKKRYWSSYCSRTCEEQDRGFYDLLDLKFRHVIMYIYHKKVQLYKNS